MKKALRNYKTYIYSTLLVVLSIGGSFLAYGIANWTNHPKFPYYILLLCFLFIYGFLAYLLGDLVIIKYRKEVHEINPPIPEEIENKAWVRRMPFTIALIVTLVVTLILFIASLALGHWPLL